jgi:hypothetical protein
MGYLSDGSDIPRRNGVLYIRYKGNVPSRTKFVEFYPRWNRKRHPSWAAYHANKDKK